LTINIRYIGLDVHKETIVIAVADAGRGEAKAWKTIPYDLPRLVKAIALLADGAEVEVCYEAGPTGFGVQRALEKAGYACQVVAPSGTLKVSSTTVPFVSSTVSSITDTPNIAYPLKTVLDTLVVLKTVLDTLVVV